MLAAPDISTRVEITPGSWVINWGEHTLHEDSVTGAHLAYLVLLNGEDSWANCDLSELPMADPGIGPSRLMSWIIAMVAVAEELHETDEVAALVSEVRGSSASKILSSLHRY